MLIPTLAVVLALANATFVTAQNAPSADATYNIIWEPASGIAPGSGSYVGINTAQALRPTSPSRD